MGFDLQRFEKTQFRHREGTVALPGLAEWFEGKPEATVRGLDGNELARVQEAEAQAKNWQAILEGLAGDAKREKVAALQELLGRTGDVPGQLVRRIEAAEIGWLDPKMDRGQIVKFASAWPIEFQQLTTEIFRLTGLGKDPGKPAGSGATPG